MKTKLLRVLAVWLTGVVLCGGLALGASAATDITAELTDPNFRAAVYDAIGKTAPAPIYDTDVGSILNLSKKNIKSLAGLEYLFNLQELSCDHNQLTQLPTLPGNLRFLDCSYNQLTQLPPLPSGLNVLRCNFNNLTGINVTGLNLKQISSNGWPAFDCSENLMTSESDVIGFAGVWGGLDYVFSPQGHHYALQVYDGSGSSYSWGRHYSLEEGTVVNINVHTGNYDEKYGKGAFVFDGWAATAGTIADRKAASTTFTMPACEATVEAMFKDMRIHLWGKPTKWVKSPLNYFLLIVCFGWIWMAF